MGLNYNSQGTASWSDLISGNAPQQAQQPQPQQRTKSVKNRLQPTDPSPTKTPGPKAPKKITPRPKLVRSKHQQLKNNLRPRPNLNETRRLHLKLQ